MASASTSRRAWAALTALVAGYLALDVIAAAPGSPLVPPFPAGVSSSEWLSRTATGMGLDRVGRLGLTLVSLVLLAVLVAAFVVLLIEAWNGRAGVGPVTVVAALCLVLVVVAPVLLSRDVYSYASYGRLWILHGANPYSNAPAAFPADPFFRVVSPEWRSTRSVYGPGFTLLSGGIVKLWPGSPGATVIAFKALAAVATGWAAMLAAAAAARWGFPNRRAFAAAAVALNPVVVVHTVGGGHNDALVALGVAAAALLAAPPLRPRRALAVTAALSLAALVKVVAVIPLLLWIWWLARDETPGHRSRFGGHLVLAAALVTAASAPLFAGWRTVTALANLATRQGWASGVRLVARALDAITPEPTNVPATAVYFVALVAYVFAVVLLQRRQGSPPHRWGTALLLFALAAPYLLPWYVAWFVPLLALIEDEPLVWAGVALAGLLALTGVPAEPDGAPDLWHSMVLGVHYGAAPVALGLLAFVVRRAFAAGPDRRADDGAAPTEPPSRRRLLG